MADKKEKAETLEKAQKAIEAVQGIDPHLAHWANDNSRRLGLGEEGMPCAELGCLLNAYQRLTPGVLGGLPVEELQRIRDFATETSELLSEFAEKRRNPSQFQGPDVFPEKARKLRKLCESSLPIIRGHADCAIELEEGKKEAEALLAKMRAHLGNAESVLDAIRKAAGEAGVSQQAVHFKEEADRHEAEAKDWRRWVGMAVAAFVGAAFLSWWWSGDVADGFALAQALASRALVFVALGFGVFFCAKNYLAHRHNAVVNRHRQKALETYRALAEADPKSREIVLAHAARCIYAPQDSGFARKGESGGGEIPIETILRLVKGKEDS